MFPKPATTGETLRLYIANRVLRNADWDAVRASVRPLGRTEGYTHYLQHATASHLTIRLVAAATRYATGASVDDPAVEDRLRAHLIGSSVVPPGAIDTISRLTLRAVAVARQKITSGTRNAFIRWARDEHPNCFICATPLAFTRADPNAKYTIEHLWPQSVGGDSEPDNFLPACSRCNSYWKRDFVSWTSPDVLSFALRPDPTPSSLGRLSGSVRYALLLRAAERLASRSQLTLREAFIQLGPLVDVRTVDSGDAADFFNLEAHNPHPLL